MQQLIEADGEDAIGQHMPGQPAARCTNPAKAGGDGGAENDEAQVEGERGGDNQPDRCVGGDQRQGAELGGAGEDDDVHAHRLKG